MARRKRATGRKTYRTKTAAKRAAGGHEIYKAKGPPAGWRISRGRKVRGKRGQAQRRRKRLISKIRKRKSKKPKKLKWIKIRIGNPNPEVCGFG